MTTTCKGTVTSFDLKSGRGKVEFPEGKALTFGATSFRSGRPARYPAKGDEVQVVLSKESGSVVSVRLVRSRT